MQEKGLEPSRHCCHRHLKPARLPIPPFLQELTKDMIPFLLAKVKKNLQVFFKKIVFFMLTDYLKFVIIRKLLVTTNCFAEVSELADEQD